MHVEVRKVEDIVIVDLDGKLTMGLGDRILRDTIDELLAEDWKKIILNLSSVSFMDSAGVGELVASLRTAGTFGARLKLVSASERAQATLYMSRLLPVFEIHAEEGEALEDFHRESRGV
jgi:anti-anti-sigma factor